VLSPVVHCLSVFADFVLDIGERFVDEPPADVDIGGVQPVVIDRQRIFLQKGCTNVSLRTYSAIPQKCKCSSFIECPIRTDLAMLPIMLGQPRQPTDLLHGAFTRHDEAIN